MVCRIAYIDLSNEEVAEISALLSSYIGSGNKMQLSSILEDVAIFSQELPRRVRKCFYDFKLNETSEVLIVQGYEINQSLIGRTPSKHRLPGQVELVNEYDVLHLLFAFLLGEPFSWTTIQNAYIINEVMPVAEHRQLIASSGADSLFDLHTEDAFHPFAGDYLSLMCLRNPNNTKTIFSCLSKFDLSKEELSVLLEPRYIIGANVAHKVPDVIEPLPILFGNLEYPYIRVNLNSTRAVDGDSRAEEVLEVLKAALRKNSVSVSLRAGDFCFIDNYRAVHGREPFAPKYDGNDRWLKRLYLTSTFRNSAAVRKQPGDRIINL